MKVGGCSLGEGRLPKGWRESTPLRPHSPPAPATANPQALPTPRAPPRSRWRGGSGRPAPAPRTEPTRKSPGGGAGRAGRRVRGGGLERGRGGGCGVGARAPSQQPGASLKRGPQTRPASRPPSHPPTLSLLIRWYTNCLSPASFDTGSSWHTIFGGGARGGGVADAAAGRFDRGGFFPRSPRPLRPAPVQAVAPQHATDTSPSGGGKPLNPPRPPLHPTRRPLHPARPPPIHPAPNDPRPLAPRPPRPWALGTPHSQGQHGPLRPVKPLPNSSPTPTPPRTIPGARARAPAGSLPPPGRQGPGRAWTAPGLACLGRGRGAGEKAV